MVTFITHNSIQEKDVRFENGFTRKGSSVVVASTPEVKASQPQVVNGDLKVLPATGVLSQVYRLPHCNRKL